MISREIEQFQYFENLITTQEQQEQRSWGIMAIGDSFPGQTRKKHTTAAKQKSY